jgi:hypothetical protein
MACEQVPQSLDVDSPAIQRGVEAAPATTVRLLKAQVNGRGNGFGGEDGVAELEEGVFPAMEAFVERAAEAAQSVVGFHDVSIMHSPKDRRIICPPARLKRKLRGRANRRVAYVSRDSRKAVESL